MKTFQYRFFVLKIDKNIHVLFELKLCLLYWTRCRLSTPILDLFLDGTNNVSFTSMTVFAEQDKTLLKLITLEIWNN